MFKTDQRQSICEILTPPDGYRLDRVVATTYSLDLTSVTAVLSAAGGQSGESESGDWSTAEVARGLLGLKHRVVIFAQQGLVRFGRAERARKLLSLYDRFIVPMSPKGAAFHPKVWLVKFTPVGRGRRDAKYRLLCASRNLTAANTWECGVILDGQPHRTPGSLGPAVAAFIRGVARAGKHDGQVARVLAAEVTQVRFDPPGGSGKWTLMSQSPSGGSLWGQLRRGDWADALFVAPFMTSRFLETLRGRFADRVRVVSTQGELDKVCHGESSRKSELREWLTKKGNAFVVLPEAPAGDHRLELHAKLLFARGGGRGETVVGSANGTSSAWGLKAGKDARNWEAALKLTGPELMSAFEREFLYESGSRSRLRPWVQDYRRQKVTKSQELQDQLDDVQRQFGGIQLQVTWNQNQPAILLTSTSPCPYDPRLFKAWMAPVGLKDPEGRLRDCRGLFGGRSLEFRTEDASSLGAFVLVRLEHQKHQRIRNDFLLVASVVADARWREARDQAVLREVLGDRELLDLVMGLLKGDGSHGSRGGSRKRGGRRGRDGKSVEGVLEPLLRTWATAPDRFDDFCAAIEGLDADMEHGTIEKLRTLIALLRSVKAASGSKGRLR